MISTELRQPEPGLVAATRGMLGAGLGLLPGDRLSAPQRKGVGGTLAAVGAPTTPPLALIVFGRSRRVGRAAALERSPR